VGGLTDAERYAFDVQGFLVRAGVLSRDEVAALNEATDGLALAPPGATVASQRFRDHLHASPTFVALLDHPAVFDVVVELCGSGVRLDHAYGIVMAPGTDGLELHGGARPFDPAQYYAVDGDGIHCGLVAAQWALVDHPTGAGGFVCIPGSHKAAYTTPDALPDGAVRDVSIAAGDVLIFTEALTHGTRRWKAPYERRTLLYKYSPGNSSWGKDEVLTPELAPMLTDRQRRLFEPPYVAYRRPV
jgi:hypothetical protein